MEDNKAILLRANDHIAKGDNEGFLSFCTEDVVWEFVGDRVLTGKQAVREYMHTEYVKPPEFNVQELIGDSDHVVAIGMIKTEDDKGKTVTSDYCDIWKFREGKLAALKAFVSKIRS